MFRLATSILRLPGYTTTIHIGPSKTGSSALQEAFSRCRKNLADSHIFYPEHKLDSNSVSSGHLHTLLKFDDQHSKWAVSKTRAFKVLTGLSNSHCDKLLLSSEFFATKDLLSSLSRLFCDLTAVAYIRNAASLISSEYVQSVKRANATLPFSLGADQSFDPWFYKRLESCAETSIPIHYLPYDSEPDSDTSILDPLLQHLSYKGHPIRCKLINPSYTLEALEFKRGANHYLAESDLAELDLILQRCEIGSTSYSILSEEQFDIIQDSTNRYISNLRGNKRMSELATALERAQLHSFNNFPSCSHSSPSSLSESMRSILLYVQETSPNIVTRLRSAVQSRPTPHTVSQDFHLAIMG